MTYTPPTLVVLRALKLGDLVAAVPALRAIARAFPMHRRVLCLPRALAPLVPLLVAVDETMDTAELAPIDPALRAADVAVNLHGRGPQSTRRLRALAPKRLIAFDEPGCARWRPDEHERDRWCRLLREAGIEADPADLLMRRPRIEPPPAAVGATLLNPGASSAARRWPVERFAAVARAELDAGRRVAVTGTADELPLAHELARHAALPDDTILAGRTSLLELAAAVGAADRVVSNDTGVAHLATALATPSVVLFGPVPPSEWGPPQLPRHRALWKGRRGDPHATRPDPGLLEIDVEDVVEALHAIKVA